MKNSGTSVGGDAKTGGGDFAGSENRKQSDNTSQNLSVNFGEEDSALTRHLDSISLQMADMNNKIAVMSASMLRLVILIDGDPDYDSVGLRIHLRNVSWRSTLALVLAALSFLLWVAQTWIW